MERQVEIEKIPGPRKHPLIACEGYLFERNRDISCGGVSYRCVNYKSCRARIHMFPDGSVLKAKHENHGPNYESITGRKIIEKGKQIMKEQRFSAIKDAIAHVEGLVREAGCNAAVLGPTRNLKRRYSDVRFKALGKQNLGNTLDELAIPADLQKTLNGERFLLYDNMRGANRMIVFASQDALDKLSFCQTWLLDGTFKSCPSLFYQLYTVHGVYRNCVSVPFIYAYLPRKTKETYLELFHVIRSKVQGEPNCIITDFEDAAILACKEVFIATELNGCLFHLSKSVYSRVQEHPEVLRRYMRSDDDGEKVRTTIRSLAALSFLPPAEVVVGFGELRGLFRPDDPVREILNYFYNSYIGRNWDEVRYPIDFWNVSARFAVGAPRTNNGAEGWHYRFNALLPKPKPTMQDSILMLRKEEQHSQVECEKIRQGLVPSKKKKSISIEKILTEIMKNRDNHLYRDHIDFLHAIQRCLHNFMPVM